MKENEREFQGWVIDVAKRHGWRVWHAPTPMRPVGKGEWVPDTRGRGLPDLYLIHDDPPRMIFAEIKGPDGVLSDGQREFLELAMAVAKVTTAEQIGGPDYRPLRVFVWKPAHRDLIEEVLRT